MMKTLGRDPLTQRRDNGRPLITYSKRPAMDIDFERVSKKQRAETDYPNMQSKPESPRLPPLPTPLATPTPPRPRPTFSRGSILHYFKPARPSSIVASSTNPFSDNDKIVTPPSSPIRLRGGSTPQLLKMRETLTQSNETGESVEDIDENEDKNREDGIIVRIRLGTPIGDDGAPLVEELVEQNAEPQGLRDGGSNLANVRRRASDPDGASKKHQKKPLARTTSVPTVQTTLNLSLKPAFAECRVCDTVYNPRHPKDVKLHTRRHARALATRTT